MTLFKLDICKLDMLYRDLRNMSSWSSRSRKNKKNKCRSLKSSVNRFKSHRICYFKLFQALKYYFEKMIRFFKIEMLICYLKCSEKIDARVDLSERHLRTKFGKFLLSPREISRKSFFEKWTCQVLSASHRIIFLYCIIS